MNIGEFIRIEMRQNQSKASLPNIYNSSVGGRDKGCP